MSQLFPSTDDDLLLKRDQGTSWREGLREHSNVIKCSNQVVRVPYDSGVSQEEAQIALAPFEELGFDAKFLLTVLSSF